MEQGPVKLSVQTLGLLLTPTLAGLVPVLGPSLRPSAHTCPTPTMMMYFWVSTGPQSVDLFCAHTTRAWAESLFCIMCVAYASECVSAPTVYTV